MKKIGLFLIIIAAAIHLSAQNVGIGTTTPSTKLHVVDLLNDVQLRVESSAIGSEAGLRLLAGNNPFSFLQFSKYGAGVLGTFAGVPKDNLSVISTGGNAGALLFNTGDGVSPLLFAPGTAERMRVQSNGQVAIGTSTPAPSGKLHVHDDISNQDVSILLTNSLTGPGSLRGGRFRFLNSDLLISNNELTGKIHLLTALNTRMTVGADGNVGIDVINPAHKLQIQNSNLTNAINVLQNGDGTRAVAVNSTGINTHGFYFTNSNNANIASNYVVGIHARLGNGGPPLLFPGSTGAYSVIGESLNTQTGIGVYGISHSASPDLIEGAVVGWNIGSGAGNDMYGVIGISSGVSGAGVAGKSFISNTPGILGFGEANGATAVRAEIKTGFTGAALEIKNGSVKVTGTSKPVFQIIAVTGPGGNTSGNTLTIPNTTQANAATDLLIVTPVYVSVYLNKPIGVWWDGTNWNIFTQDLSAMPNGAVFNVMVVKQ
jgi:hypothetical protein